MHKLPFQYDSLFKTLVQSQKFSLTGIGPVESNWVPLHDNPNAVSL